MTDFESIFRTGDSLRDNFLSRVFGILNEGVVRFWCANPQSAFVDLGRPTVHTPEGKWHTLDFTLRNQESGLIYVAEMKCELAYDGYQYLRLVDASQLDHHRGAAFTRFLEVARSGHRLVVKVTGKPLDVDGAVLVWGATTSQGVASVLEVTGLADVLSVESMVNDLGAWQDAAWANRVSQIRSWCTELFDYLAPT